MLPSVKRSILNYHCIIRILFWLFRILSDIIYVSIYWNGIP